MDNNCPVVLLILDGWGYSADSKHNAIAAAKTPQWDEWWQTRPHILLDASGHQVGLPDEQMGNSEVGHMHIGAGRVIYQDFTRINQAIATGDFARNAVFINLIEALKIQGKTFEGATGGFIFAMLIVIGGHYFFQPVHSLNWFLIAIITAIISVFGDLFVSMLKRRSKIKDTGRLLPGHGGILDRLDSLMAALPFFYFGLIYLAPGL